MANPNVVGIAPRRMRIGRRGIIVRKKVVEEEEKNPPAKMQSKESARNPHHLPQSQDHSYTQDIGSEKHLIHWIKSLEPPTKAFINSSIQLFPINVRLI